MPRAQKGAQRASFDQTDAPFLASSPSRPRRSSRGTQALLRAIAVSLPTLLLLSALAAPATAHDLDRALDRRVDPTLRPGDVLVDHGISIAVPPAGGFAWGELKFADGTWQEVGAQTDRRGRVFVLGKGDERAAVLRQRRALAAQGLDPAGVASAASTQAGGGLAECRDDYRNLYWWRTPRLDWRFNPAGTPSSLRDEDGGTKAVAAALMRAQRNITGVTNRCDRNDKVSAKGGLMGTTSRRPDISAGGSCRGGDGRSVIQFADLPSYSIAMTCVYGVREHRAAEADIRINNVTTRWALGKASCTGRELLLEAGMTHEFGHAYGLAHASIYRNPSLTMQPLVDACSRAHASLGLGDMLGLEKKY